MVWFWAAVLAISMLIYVVLDGMDLGVGMLFGLARDEMRRRQMMSAVAPIWDGNETWLVVSGVTLWAAFPLAYSILMPAFYLPVLLGVGGLILRGVAFEYRHQTERWRWTWDASFAGGSLVAAFMQGVMIGALVHGLPVSNGRYAGGLLGWLSPFAVLCGFGLCAGYMLLGACWLVRKCEGAVREAAYRMIPPVSLALLAFLIVVFASALGENLAIIRRWLERPYLFVFPVVAGLAAIELAMSVLRRRDRPLIVMVIVVFLAAYSTLAISFWPYMIPFAVTIEQAAAPHSSLAFMFWFAGVIVFPLMIIYTTISVVTFRGKIKPAEEHY
jgi:cytochrome d ubiquinol oxidase subunit II